MLLLVIRHFPQSLPSGLIRLDCVVPTAMDLHLEFFSLGLKLANLSPQLLKYIEQAVELVRQSIDQAGLYLSKTPRSSL